MDNEMIPLSLSDNFSFSCSPEIECFNQCCKNLNQYLTPYDILRLKNRLKLPSDIFLRRFTSQHKGPETGLPIISLKADVSELKCPFVSQKGCTVYQDRPSSCRAYPLFRLASRSRETGRISDQYFLVQEPHCLGFSRNQNWTVQKWIESQELTVYNKFNDMLLEILSLKKLHLPGPMDIKSELLFHMALYDIDRFRYNIFEKKILNSFKIDSAVIDIIKEDDPELLKIGFRWVKEALFDVIEES